MRNHLISKLIGIALLSILIFLPASPAQSSSHETNLFETLASYVIIDGEILFTFELINNSTTAQNLRFGSGQQFEIIVLDVDGKEVYRYSDGKFFTLALIYRCMQPGESLKWQDRWNLTNKDGEALPPGKYTAEIRILASSENKEHQALDEQLSVTNYIDLDAKSIIEKVSHAVITAIKDKDANTISEFVHPIKGVRFTPYTHISLDQDLVFTQTTMKNFFTDQNTYLWGYYDGSGYEILLTPNEYYEKFIYTHDFIHAEQIGYNEVLSFGNMLENQFEIYKEPIIVEYYFSGFNPAYAGMDWRSLRLVFEEYEGVWKLVGIIYNQWTV